MTNARKIKRDVKLDSYEAELEKTIGKAKQLPKKLKGQHLANLKNAAENYMTKNKRISIRVYGSDLENIKRIALQEGLPYQTLITSVLHKFATGRLSQQELHKR